MDKVLLTHATQQYTARHTGGGGGDENNIKLNKNKRQTGVGEEKATCRKQTF